MNKTTFTLMAMPRVFMVGAFAVHVALEPGALIALWGFTALAFVASFGCLARAVTLLKAGRAVGYLCGAAGIVYIAFLVIMCTPAKTRTATQRTALGAAGLRLVACCCSGVRRI